MKSLIAQLNYVAKDIAREGISPLRAIEETANRFMLIEIEERDNCRIYQTADETLINCWIDGVQSDKIEDGGIGFDNQVGWFLDDLITQATAAKIYGELTGNIPTVQAINQAIQKRQLIGYKNPAAKHKRQAATLVSEAAVRELWR